MSGERPEATGLSKPTTPSMELTSLLHDHEHHVHLQLFHRGRVPLQVREYESFTRAKHPAMWPEPEGGASDA